MTFEEIINHIGIKPYYQDNAVVIYHADCRDILSLIPDKSVDLVLTDPPYGISFMGKSWDKALPDKQIWAECFRVLRDGAFAFVMSIPRADCLSRMIISLEDAGFWVNFTPLFHCFASGFPKAENVAKVILKRFLQVSLQDVSRSPDKDGDSQSDSRCHFCGGLLQNGLVVFRDALPLSNDVQGYNRLSSPSADIQVDNEHKHKVSYALLSFHHATQDLKPLASWQTIVSSVLQSKPDDWLPQFSAGNWGLGDRFPSLHGYGQRDSISGNSNVVNESEMNVLSKPDKSEKVYGKIHKLVQSHLYYNKYCPACQEQMSNKFNELQGSYAGMQVKPAVEIIIVAMKPLSEKTFVDQALKNKKGITWLDEGRIPFEDTQDPATNPKWRVEGGYKMKRGNRIFGNVLEQTTTERISVERGGRFPANLLVSDDVLNDGERRISGVGFKGTQNNMTCFSGFRGDSPNPSVGGDSGSFSRYFDLDKWFEERIKQLPKSVQKTFPFLIVPKASKSEKNKGLGDLEPIQTNDGRNKLPDNAFQRGKTYRTNSHPTVKPLKLMSYLITLGSRSGDIVLDPFVGSGTTMLACKLMNRKAICCEIEEKYCEIAAKRCSQMVMELKV